MSSIVLRSLTALGLALAFPACGSDPAEPAAPQAELKLVHVSASPGAADLYIDGQPVLTGVGAGSSRVARVPAGMQQLSVRKAGVQVGTVGAQLSVDQLTSVVLSEAGMQVYAATPDTGQAATNRANIRIINITSDATSPTLLHMLINYPGVSPDSTARIGIDHAIASHGTLMYFDPGLFRFRLVPQGTTTVLHELTFNVEAGQKKAVVIRRENGVYRFELVTEL